MKKQTLKEKVIEILTDKKSKTWNKVKVKDYIPTLATQLLTQIIPEILGEEIETIRNLTVPGCPPKENSEYHLGFNDARIHYAELKLKIIKDLEAKKREILKKLKEK